MLEQRYRIALLRALFEAGLITRREYEQLKGRP